MLHAENEDTTLVSLVYILWGLLAPFFPRPLLFTDTFPDIQFCAGRWPKKI